MLAAAATTGNGSGDFIGFSPLLGLEKAAAAAAAAKVELRPQNCSNQVAEIEPKQVRQLGLAWLG